MTKKNRKVNTITKDVSSNSAPISPINNSPERSARHNRRKFHNIEEVLEKIFYKLENGESLTSICSKENADMPDKSTFCRWLNDPKNEELRRRYQTSILIQADLAVDSLKDLAQKLINREIDAQQHRTLSDNIKWTAGRMSPKKWGDRVDVTSSDGSISTPSINVVFVDSNSAATEQLEHDNEYSD